MRTETITLAGNEYTLHELPLRQNAEWRKELDAALSEYSELLGRTTAINLADSANVIAVIRAGARGCRVSGAASRASGGREA